MKQAFLMVLALVIAALAACYTGPELSAAHVGDSRDAGTAAGGMSGLPCDVAEVLARSCARCHGIEPKLGAHTALVSRENLMAAWNGRGTLAAESVARMRDATNPMPPEGMPAEADVAILEAWIAAGLPEGSCASVVADAAPPNVVCTSGRYWTKGDDEGDEEMTPGRACIACHTAEAHHKKQRDGDDDDEDDDEDEDLPRFTAAGTLYPSLYEPDDCYGVTSQAPVVFIEGADGVRQALRVNEAGNFMTERPIATPYKAWVTNGQKTLRMQATQTDGDCNGCHVADVADPTGRIVAPF